MREGRESTVGFGKILRNSRLPLRLFREVYKSAGLSSINYLIGKH